jgi:NAD(P)-dependent dehydrogenase (short-subunit alcohol dehydrogenase family)
MCSNLTAFSRALAEEYGKTGIRVNTVVPGMIDSPMAVHDVGKILFYIISAFWLSIYKDVVQILLTCCQRRRG